MPDETPPSLPNAARVEREQFATQLRELEAFVAREGSEGEELPPVVIEMIARLREIVAALDGLTGSLGDDESR